MHLRAVYLAGYYQFLLESIRACFASNHIIQNGKSVDLSIQNSGGSLKSQNI